MTGAAELKNRKDLEPLTDDALFIKWMALVTKMGLMASLPPGIDDRGVKEKFVSVHYKVNF